MENKKKTLIISGEATYRVEGAISPPVSVMVKEISASGLKFITTEKLEVNTSLELSIKVTESSDPIPVMGKVVWQGYASSKFLLDTDIEFSKISAKDESRIANFITNSVENIKSNRGNVRCPMAVEVIYTTLSAPGKEEQCESADIGVEGMRLFVKKNINTNDDLKLAFNLPRGWGAVNVNAIVAWTGQTMNGITPIGVKFLNIQNRTKKRILHFVDYALSQHSE